MPGAAPINLLEISAATGACPKGLQVGNIEGKVSQEHFLFKNLQNKTSILVKHCLLCAELMVAEFLLFIVYWKF
jgi:hypothetical protein